MFNPLKHLRNTKVGLALGSGGAKGISHIAVIEYILALGIPVDMIAGSSIGAVIGAVFCTGNLDRFKKDLLDLSRTEMLSLFDPVLPRSGFLRGRKFIDFLSDYIPGDALIQDLDVPLAILATDYYSARSVVFKSGNILEALRASISVPGILEPVKFKQTYLVDGGVANPLPVNIVKNMGAGISIAVNLHPITGKQRLKSYVGSRVNRPRMTVDSRNIMSLTDSTGLDVSEHDEGINWFNSVEHWLGMDADNKNKKQPNVFEVISQSVDIMEIMNTMLLLKFYSPSVLIEPQLPETGTLDFTDIPEILKGGYLACTKSRNAIIRKVKLWI